MAVDNDTICVIFTPSNLCYLCVLSDVCSLLKQIEFSSTHQVSRIWLSQYWNSNFTQIIEPSHIVILHSTSRIAVLKKLLVAH